MSYTTAQIADGVWTHATRTIDSGSPALSNGSVLDDIAYAVWTYTTRTVEGGVAPVTGTGSGSQTAQSGAGLGIVLIEALGSGSQEPQTGVGAGIVLILGTGSGSQATQTGSSSLPVISVDIGRRYMSILEQFRGNYDICMTARVTTVGTARNSMNDMGRLQAYHDAGATAFPHTAAKVEISPVHAQDIAAGTGAQAVTVYGVDGDFNFISEEVVLGAAQYGITKTVGLFRYVYGAFVSRAGSGLINAGPIWLTVDGKGGTYASGVPGTLTSSWMNIPTGLGSATTGIYVVPPGKKAIARHLNAGARTQVSHLYIVCSDLNYSSLRNIPLVREEIVLANSGAVQIIYPQNTGMIFGEKTLIALQALSSTAGGVISADFEFSLQNG